MIDRQKMLEEQLLRENIRRAIRIVKEKHNKDENYVRTIVRHLLNETEFKYDYMSLNLLGHFMKETVGNVDEPDGAQPFKQAYTDLSSGHEDREIFVEFMLDFSNEDFKTIDASKQPKALGQDFVERGFAEDEPEEPEEDKIINVSVKDLEDNDGDLNPIGEEEEEEFTIGEDGEYVEIEEEEPDSGIKVYSREAYKKFGAALRRYYGQVEKDNMLNKAVEIDGKEYQPGELSERDLFKIYFKKNVLLWAGRYEKEFFNDTPEAQVNIQSAGEEEEIVADEEEFDLGL